jgi:dethiobiotin synthetase
MRGCFVTGTDTGVGKTWVSAGLIRALQARGRTTLGMKPVASGCEATAEGLRNEDAVALRAVGSRTVPYELVNPYAFAPPIAPHLAAEQADIEIALARISACFAELSAQSDFVVVEGVGGWMVPLNEREDVADLAAALELPVVLVVGVRLGCLNHALLSAEAIARRGLPLAGWVANLIEPETAFVEENVRTLEARLDAPLLGRIPFADELDPDAVAAALDVEPLDSA